MAAFPASFSSITTSFPPPSSSSRPSFLPRSAAEPPSVQTPNPSSLSDQLLPLSLTLLTHQSHPALLPPSKPNPTWTNPSKPKPRIILPHRHPRTPHSHNPDSRRLSLLSRSLSSSSDFDAAFPDTPPPHADALLLLNSLRPWQTSHRFFLWLQSKSPSSPLPTIFYNVALKSLRSGLQYSLADSLAAEMIALAVPLDNITYSTLITCASRCRRFDRALFWFDRLYRTGLIPDDITYSAVLHVYAHLGRLEDAVALYERGRAAGWTPDPVAFSVLARMFGRAGDYDGIQYVLREVRTIGVKPNAVVYNTLLDALGRAGKPGLARNLFDEMLAAGLQPDEKTLTAMVRIYGRARWGRDALELWEKMKAKKWPMDFILYNTLLTMCADLGLEEDAEKLFHEMRRSAEGPRPDNFSYTAMIKIYASGGKADAALRMFDEMLAGGVEPNVMGCTCLIQCLGKVGRIDDAVRIFETSMARGIKPDDRLCGCLLSLVALCGETETGKVTACLEKANPRLARFLRILPDDGVPFNGVRDELREILNGAAVDVRRPFCNCLMDICRNRGYPARRAHELLSLGMMYGLYPGLHAKGPEEWCLNLRSLSVGAANTAFEQWMETLSDSIERGEEIPGSFCVQTGSGSHRLSQGLGSAFSSFLESLAAPFKQIDETGCFVARKEQLIPWLSSTGSVVAFAR